MREDLDEVAIQGLHINYGLRGAFTHGKPLSREEYENSYVLHGPGAYMVAPPYEEYLKLYDKYSEACRMRELSRSLNDSYLANNG